MHCFAVVNAVKIKSRCTTIDLWLCEMLVEFRDSVQLK